MYGAVALQAVTDWATRAVSTEECHSQVEFMHRRSTTYCENGPLQMEQERNKDRTKNVMVQQ